MGVAVAEVLAFLLARGLAVLRVHLSRRGAWRRANSLDPRQEQAIDEWEDVERPKSPIVTVV